MKEKHHKQYAQRFKPHQRLCEIRMDADRIEIRTQGCSPALLKKVADGLEDEMLCCYAVVEEDVIYLMAPDYGMFIDDNEFQAIVSELFAEQNYELIYK